MEFIAEYGGKCSCKGCVETHEVFLTLEHKRRDGSRHRQAFGTSTEVLRDLKRKGWPKRNYCLLCFNCNRARWQLGYCPHERKVEGRGR
jgi:hypothetical protein